MEAYMADLRDNCVKCGLALPPVYITTRDFGQLERLARLCIRSHRPAAAALAAELDRAIVCAPDAVMKDVVTMNSRIIFRTSDGAGPQSRILVYPHRYHPSGQFISVLSPLGAALIGLREGSRMLYADLHGVGHEVRVQKVAYQPEADERRRS
jgi:regulator of nucleoside diphosphate kinase